MLAALRAARSAGHGQPAAWHASLSITQDYLGVRDEELFDALDFLTTE
jgi:hypothetical protein